MTTHQASTPPVAKSTAVCGEAIVTEMRESVWAIPSGGKPGESLPGPETVIPGTSPNPKLRQRGFGAHFPGLAFTLSIKEAANAA